MPEKIETWKLDFATNGWTVRIGDHRFVYGDRDKLVADFEDYLDGPARALRIKLNSGINREILNSAEDVTVNDVPLNPESRTSEPRPGICYPDAYSSDSRLGNVGYQSCYPTDSPPTTPYPERAGNAVPQELTRACQTEPVFSQSGNRDHDSEVPQGTRRETRTYEEHATELAAIVNRRAGQEATRPSTGPCLTQGELERIYQEHVVPLGACSTGQEATTPHTGDPAPF